jgi:hypothetical protein
MKKVSFIIIGLVLMVTAKIHAYDGHDFQVWNTDVEEFKINNDAKIALEEEFRWQGNANEFYYHHYDIGFFYNLKKFLNIGGGYRHVYELKKGKFKLENEPYVTTALFWGLLGFKFEDRNRMEYRHFDYQADSWRYRNKFTVKLPWKFTKLEVQPYIADEIFLDFQNKAFSRNRFYSGFGMSLTSNLKAEIYYLLQSTRSGVRWIDANVLGSKVKLSF